MVAIERHEESMYFGSSLPISQKNIPSIVMGKGIPVIRDNMFYCPSVPIN